MAWTLFDFKVFRNGQLVRPALAPGACRTFIRYGCGLDLCFMECGHCNLTAGYAVPTDPRVDGFIIKLHMQFFSAMFGFDFSQHVMVPAQLKPAEASYDDKDAAHTGWQND
mmetsp:Transcript_27875/g.45255  ORF Transcript_27875/g.45255 Transcript_27875/m.45255 type:complete len:111 (-) Transcript_27875:222-554(-)|eukprot:CAMPEP_0184647428 /NCGR_PEP_ID=MMETSP0308-20130426/4349_1 /TAXON_ID=38269 /ORGANISM="Gloeochaete witrockiana, Strain SAG 46.84" /LENGTH=110 /DNA_ID=CAMNT_0027078365 /DNA_START=593 /DNA_END=925 /DNA_ORIENTATION=-